MPLAGNRASIHAYNRCHHVLAVSHSVGANLIEHGVRPEIVSTHYLGIPDAPEKDSALRRAARSEFEIPENAIVVGNLAFDAPFKGVDILLHAFRTLAATYDNVYLLQVGVQETSQLLGLARSLGISQRVRWAGIRDHGFQLMNAADFYVQPSRFGEGLPLSIMEAMALQLPVVATQVSGNTEAVIHEETGLLVAPGEHAELAAGMIRMIDMRHLWARIGENGLIRFQSLFDGKRSVGTLIHQYFDF
jgi:glycosyltransferase involved in cell wall biosynthesis